MITAAVKVMIGPKTGLNDEVMVDDNSSSKSDDCAMIGLETGLNDEVMSDDNNNNKSDGDCVADSAARAASDPSTDRTCYQVVLGALSVCILHEEPHTGSRKDWLTKMEALSKAFFQGTLGISAAGQALSLVQLRDELSAILPRDHLG